MGINNTKYNGKATLILEYIKVFIWPAIVVLIFLFFKNDLLQIMKERQFKLAGGFIEIGQKVREVKENVQIELADIYNLLEEFQKAPDNSPKAIEISKTILQQIEDLSSNLNKDVAQIGKETNISVIDGNHQQDTVTGNRLQAKLWERKGFEFIISKKIDAAINAFDKASSYWPQYHNVHDISILLKNDRNVLVEATRQGNNEPWRKLYRELLTKYSWGMPTDVRIKLRE